MRDLFHRVSSAGAAVSHYEPASAFRDCSGLDRARWRARMRREKAANRLFCAFVRYVIMVETMVVGVKSKDG